MFIFSTKFIRDLYIHKYSRKESSINKNNSHKN
jgi:hypothetical protein